MRVFRRILKLAVIAAAIGALASWLRSRSSEETESSDEEDLPWPPIVTVDSDNPSQVTEPNDGSPVEPRGWLSCDEIALILTKPRRRIAAASTMYLVGIPTTEQYLTGAMRRQKQQKLMATDHLNDSF